MLQDREALPDLRAILRDERVDASVRCNVAETLVTLQDREALPDILAILRDERVHAGVRHEMLNNALWRLAQAEKIPIRF